MANYPYPANFLANLPAYPVRQFCGQMNENYTKNEDLIVAFDQALQVYTNFTGNTSCLDISSAYDSSLDATGWEFQTCTEMVMPMCSNGTTDMFPPKKWDFKKFSDDCYKKWKVIPQENAAMTKYGQKFTSFSNIIFSNGLLDPWSGGGVLRTFNNDIEAVILPEGAHHIDLREENEKDPRSVKDARRKYMKFFNQWIKI
jgi:lysosomal Pro-X carboxypeptidase